MCFKEYINFCRLKPEVIFMQILFVNVFNSCCFELFCLSCARMLKIKTFVVEKAAVDTQSLEAFL